MSLALTATLLVVACSGSSTTSSLAAGTGTSTTSTTIDIVGADLVITGKVVTMTDSGVAEAVAIDRGLVVAVGDIDTVMSHAGPSTPVIELGDSYVAYPGFVDAHAHWIGDREQYGVDPAEEGIDLALSHGWTSIAELWVNRERLDELMALDKDGRLTVRVDGYLALNHPGPAGERLGDWYLDYGAGMSPSDHLRVRGVKFTIDSYWGTQKLWEAGELAEAFITAQEAGWQIASHTMSTDSHQMVLDAFDAALGGEPNLLHHRIEHAVQVTDDQLRRIAELGLVVVGHTGGFPTDSYADPEYLEYLGEDTAWLNRYRDFVDAAIRFASATDTPWMYPDLDVAPDLGRPQDLIAGAMDGKGTDGTEPPPFIEAQTLTFEQALLSVTSDAAYAIGADDLRGHLEPGTYGDITILSGDMAGASPEELRGLRVVATIVGGKILFCDDQVLCS